MLKEKYIRHFICNSTYIFHICSFGCIIGYNELMVTHEMTNGQCPKALKSQFAYRSQISNYQTRNSDILQIILHLGAQKKVTDYLMFLERIISHYNSCFSLFLILPNQVSNYQSRNCGIIQIKSFPLGSHIRSSDYLMPLNLDAFDCFNAT